VTPPIAELSGVTVAYRERLVLRGVDLAIAPGERVALSARTARASRRSLAASSPVSFVPATAA